MGRLIVHWSPLHGQARTTSSMGAIALAMSQIIEGRICITSTQYNAMSDLEGMFNNRMAEKNKQLIYKASGLNALITNIKRDRLTADDVEGCTMPTPINNVGLIPGIKFDGRLSSGDETDRLVYKILSETVKSYYDWTFVDLAAGDLPQSRRFIEGADVVVVTLSQNRAMWKMFFDQFADIAEKENVFYLIGGHKPDSRYSAKNFARSNQKYGTRLRATGAVPDCVGYMDAISEGSVPAFFIMNSRATKKEENGDFVRGCTDTATKLMKFAIALEEGPQDDTDDKKEEW